MLVNMLFPITNCVQKPCNVKNHDSHHCLGEAVGHNAFDNKGEHSYTKAGRQRAWPAVRQQVPVCIAPAPKKLGCRHFDLARRTRQAGDGIRKPKSGPVRGSWL